MIKNMPKTQNTSCNGSRPECNLNKKCFEND
jgi:hypothetical protein